ncbi:Flp pilus assembly protein CpaB [Gemmatimonas sp.]|jgi:pilus assembly protein CpaB|uniref:Flp pilus assembly protein CpaB n=1 Tax=Gemmatimonas sp. TaxID=1962908 RepID=UPI0027B900ED|nr:Flp pilus assembly protein CpaB [Gemmatimonas sp.]
MPLNRYSIVLAATLVTAGSATFGVYRVLESTRAQNRVQLRQVLVATKDIPEGSTLSRGILDEEAWPLVSVPAGALASLDSAVGRVTRVAVYAGEVIVPGRLAPVGTGPGLQVKITPGKRAMAVKIDDVVGVSGLIQPDSRVDVLVTLRDQRADGEQVAKLFMSNMRVLSVGTVDRSGPDNRPIIATSATLEVTPMEAERLAVAMRDGTIQLVLRGFGDPDSVATVGATSEDVLLRPRKAPPPPPEPKPVIRRVIVRVPEKRPEPPVAAVVPAPTPVVPVRKPDTLTVDVIRGDKLTQQRFEKPDSTKKPDSRKKPDSTTSKPDSTATTPPVC